MASVGVCTRPIELLDEPETMARARLAFTPTSQSAFARLSAAVYRLSYSEPSFSSSRPFRMASSVSCFEAAMSVTIPLSVRICRETRRNGSGSIGKSSSAVFV